MHENPIPTPPAPAPMRRYAEVTEEVSPDCSRQRLTPRQTECETRSSRARPPQRALPRAAAACRLAPARATTCVTVRYSLEPFLTVECCSC